MLIQIVVFEGFDELDAIAPWEVFSMAARRVRDWKVEFVTVDGAERVVAANGLKLQLEPTRLGLERRPDLLLVPGGGWADRSSRGARAEAARGVLPAAIAELHQAGTIIASVCTGAMLVAAAGLFRGRSAATHHLAQADLKAYGAEVIAARVVDDGDLLSAGGITSGLDLALWIIERILGPEIAAEVSQRLEYERRGTVWRRSEGN